VEAWEELTEGLHSEKIPAGLLQRRRNGSDEHEDTKILYSHREFSFTAS